MIGAVVVFALIAGTVSFPALQSFSLGDDGTYQFFYETGKDAGSHSREESRGADGVVVGKYSYQDPLGDMRVVNYRADDFGYVAKGDVSVPGAPPGQFPAEEEDKGDAEESPSNDSSSTKTGADSKESSTTEAPQEDSEDYEDDTKSMKLQEPSYDGPPDGFPVGFFDQSFQGLRRLPEPTAEEDEEQEKSASPEKGEEETPSSDQKTEDEKKQENPGAPTHLSPLFPFTNVDPHTVFNLYHPPGGSYHNPVYVYSYQHPESHGYYYTF